MELTRQECIEEYFRVWNVTPDVQDKAMEWYVLCETESYYASTVAFSMRREGWLEWCGVCMFDRRLEPSGQEQHVCQ